MGLGFTIASGRWWLAIIFVALFLGIYLPVMRVESATLAQLFGESFREYAKAVPVFLAAHNAISKWPDEGRIRPKLVSEVSRVSSRFGFGHRMGVVGIQGLLSEMKQRSLRPFTTAAVAIGRIFLTVRKASDSCQRAEY